MIQIIVNGLIEGLAIGILALSFGLVYNTLRVFHFAFGALYAIAAYAYIFGLGWFGILVSILLAVVVEALVYYPLFQRRASLAVSFISSLGVYIILVNLIALFFGNDTKMLSPEVRATINIGPVILTDIQLWLLLFSLVVCVLFVLLLHKTRLGNSLLAVGENLLLLRALGGNVRMLRTIAMVIASALAGVIAILKGLDAGIDPYIGMGAMFTAAAAFIISGGRNYTAIILAGLVLGLLRNLTVWFLSAQWMDAATFLLLVLMLMFRQRGFVSNNIRLEEQ